MTMSVLTNSVYASCDLWQQFNRLVAYNIRQDATLIEVAAAHSDIRDIYAKCYLTVKKLDIVKMVKQLKARSDYKDMDNHDIFEKVAKKVEAKLSGVQGFLNSVLDAEAQKAKQHKDNEAGTAEGGAVQFSV